MCDSKILDCAPFSTVQGNIINIVKRYPDGITYDDLMRTYKSLYNCPLDYESYGFESLAECLENVPGLQPKLVNGVMSVYLSIKAEFYFSQNDHQQECSETIKNMDDDQPEIDERLKEKFENLLRQHPRGIFSRDFPLHFKALYKEEFDLSQTGYYNLIDIVHALPDVFIRIQPDGCQSDWLLFSAEKAQPEQLLQHFKSNENVQAYSDLDNVILNIRRILQAYPDGIFADELSFSYRMNCEIPLIIQNLGFENLSKFLIDIEDKVPFRCEYPNGRTKLYYACNSGGFSPSYYARMPFDIVSPNRKYQQEQLPAIERGQFFHVQLACPQSTSEMYIQLLEDHSATQEFLDMVSDLNRDVATERYRMQPQDIFSDGSCAALWEDGAWYRSRIIEVKDDQVKVQFVDYGNIGLVQKKNLRYLKECHFNVPAQAIRTRLFFTCPDKVWASDDEAKLLSEMFSNDIKYVASVVKSECCPDIPSIMLCDASDPTEICFNSLLIREGLATVFNEHLEDLQSHSNSSVNLTLPSEENNANELFGSDDDETFDEILQQYGCVQRYVQRIYLNGDYVIHLLSLERNLYVSECDILKLFWSNEHSLQRTTLQRRLHQYNAHVNNKVVFDSDYPDLFQQLLFFSCNGIKHTQRRTCISLYLLQDLLYILNIFGHPSATIRHEISNLIRQYNPDSAVWQSFAEPTKEDRKPVELNVKKFEKLCLYDLYAILEGLKFKRVKHLKVIRNNPFWDPYHEFKNQIKMWETQIVKYRRRIQEIEELCC